MSSAVRQRSAVAVPAGVGGTGPGRYFADHPVAYRLSLAGAGGAFVYAVLRAARVPGRCRVPWIALAVLQAGIVAGIAGARWAAGAHRDRRADGRRG